MKRWFRRHKSISIFITIIIAIIFLFAIPLAINWLFKVEAPFELLVAEWDSGDALSFYSALLASVSTIIGVYLSILYAQKNYREDERNRNKPYFALTHLRSKSNVNILNTIYSKKEDGLDPAELMNPPMYEEFKIERVYVDIAVTGIKFKSGLTDEQQKILANAGAVWKRNGNEYTLVSENYISLPFDVENVGNGAAIDFVVTLYKNGNARRGMNLYTIKKNGSIYFHIFSECKSESIYGEYILELQYHDVIGTKYSQKYPITFEINNEGRLKMLMDFSGKQEIVEEEDNGQIEDALGE